MVAEVLGGRSLLLSLTVHSGNGRRWREFVMGGTVQEKYHVLEERG